jgi:hypothetical protein
MSAIEVALRSPRPSEAMKLAALEELSSLRGLLQQCLPYVETAVRPGLDLVVVQLYHYPGFRGG